MAEKRNLKQISRDYLNKIKSRLPRQKSPQLFIIGIIGLIGSGKTTVGRMLERKLTGAVLLKSDSARFLLKKAGLGYDKAKEVLYPVAVKLLGDGHAVIFDGDCVSKEKRGELQKFAAGHKAKLYFIRIRPDKDAAFGHLQKRWRDIEKGKVKQNFDNFLVVTREKEDNLFRRVRPHRRLRNKDIPRLLGTIDNSGKIKDLEKQVDALVKKIK